MKGKAAGRRREGGDEDGPQKDKGPEGDNPPTLECPHLLPGSRVRRQAENYWITIPALDDAVVTVSYSGQ